MTGWTNLSSISGLEGADTSKFRKLWFRRNKRSRKSRSLYPYERKGAHGCPTEF